MAGQRHLLCFEYCSFFFIFPNVLCKRKQIPRICRLEFFSPLMFPKVLNSPIRALLGGACVSHREWARVYAAPGHLAVTTSGEGPRGGAPSPHWSPSGPLVAVFCSVLGRGSLAEGRATAGGQQPGARALSPAALGAHAGPPVPAFCHLPSLIPSLQLSCDPRS